jgi:hypothetical protein
MTAVTAISVTTSERLMNVRAPLDEGSWEG